MLLSVYKYTDTAASVTQIDQWRRRNHNDWQKKGWIPTASKKLNLLFTSAISFLNSFLLSRQEIFTLIYEEDPIQAQSGCNSPSLGDIQSLNVLSPFFFSFLSFFFIISLPPAETET